jgi:hypothetical protein
MGIKQFQINSKQSPYQVFAANAQDLSFTIDFDDDNHPKTLTIQYDIDDSGKAIGVTFSNGATTVKKSVDTPLLQNSSVDDSFALSGGVNGHLGIDLMVVQDNSQTESIDINYTNAQAAAMVMKNHVERGMMKDVKKIVSSAVKSGIGQHVRKMHSKTKRK